MIGFLNENPEGIQINELAKEIAFRKTHLTLMTKPKLNRRKT